MASCHGHGFCCHPFKGALHSLKTNFIQNTRVRPIRVKWPMSDVPIFRRKNSDSDVRCWYLVGTVTSVDVDIEKSRVQAYASMPASLRTLIVFTITFWKNGEFLMTFNSVVDFESNFKWYWHGHCHLFHLFMLWCHWCHNF